MRQVRTHLREEEVLAVWSSASHDRFASSLEELFSEMRIETVQWHNDLIDEDQFEIIFLARR